MASSDTLLPSHDGAEGESGGLDGAGPVVAQFVVTKITFWGSYRRILTLTATHAALYNPDDFTCTNQWFLSSITDIEIAPDPDQFVLVLEKVRFQAHRLRFHCPARAQLIALLHKLRRKYSFLPLRVSDYDAGRRQQHYECSEHYADDSYDYFLLHVGVAGATLLDENGRKVGRFPYRLIQRIALSSAHPDGLVISTLFEERLFLCHPRNDCIDHMCAAAQALGVTLTVDESPLNMQLLRLRNSQALDNPAVVCFEVAKRADDSTLEEHIQLIFQGTAMIEVHRRLRTIITRPYSMLLTVVLSEWDADTVVLQFVQDERLIVRVDARDQFVAILLLVCRESGNEQVELSHSTMKKSRLFHPHISEKVHETVGTSMESFFLKRVLRILASDDPPVRSTSPLREFGGVTHDHAWANGKKKGKSKRQHSQRRRGLRPNAVMMEARLSPSMGISLNAHIGLAVALEELNANVSLNGFSDNCSRQLLNRTIEVLVEHLVSLVASLRANVGAPTEGIVTALQALARMAQSRHAFFPEELVPSLFDALYELVSRHHFLTSYWVFKLLQRYFEPRKGPEARRHRANAMQTFVENRTLLYAILDVIPEKSSLSRSSSGRWMRSGTETNRPNQDDESDASVNPDLDQTLLFTKEERLEKDMNILTYEALFTLHHVLIYLLTKEKQEGEAVVSILSKTKLLEEQRAGREKHWASTINLDDSEYDLDLHQTNYDMAATAKRGIGEKLMAKYKFLMDSVVDVRLARSCQTIVALINFLVNFFRDEINAKHNEREPSYRTLAPPGGFVLYEDERADPDGTMLYQVGSDTEYRRKRETLPLSRSFLDVSVSDVSTEEAEIKKQERQLNELFAFLECYEADVATLDNRSRLFPEQNTILVPLMSFSRMSSAASSNHSFFNVSGIKEELARLRERDEDFLTLDQLHFDDNVGPQTPRERRVTIVSPAERRGRPRSRRHSQPTSATSTLLRPSLLHPGSSTNSEDISIVDSRPESSGSQFVPRFMASSNFRRLDEARVKAIARQRQQLHRQAQQQEPRRQARPWLHEDRSSDRRALPSVKPAADPRPRAPSRPAAFAVDDRISAHTCDACIACNDVCENENCFFCAEKEFQLQAAFASSSLPRSPVSATLSSSLNADRKYSSCEVGRHQSARSCWVIVFGFVYDVTDLLSSHPGGMDVLLTAAAVGKDMGELFVKKHPARARRVLENYYLGEFYECENRTVLV